MAGTPAPLACRANSLEYLSAGDLLDRIDAMGFDAEDLARLHYVHFPEFEIDQPLGAQRVLAGVRAHHADVVVIDTLVRAIGGREENAEALSHLYKRVSAPLKRAGVTIIRLDHTGHGDQRRARGSSDKAADIDASWTLRRAESGPARITLDLALQRSIDHLSRVAYEIRSDPLQFHRVTPAPSDDLTPEVRELVYHLDRLDVPRDFGRDRVRELLTAKGIQPGRNELVREALNVRRRRQHQREAMTPVPEPVPVEIDQTCGDSPGTDMTFSQVVSVPDSSGTEGTASVSDLSPHLSPLEGDRGRSNRPDDQTRAHWLQGKGFAQGGTTGAVPAAAERGTSGEEKPKARRPPRDVQNASTRVVTVLRKNGPLNRDEIRQKVVSADKPSTYSRSGASVVDCAMTALDTLLVPDGVVIEDNGVYHLNDSTAA